MEGTKKALWLFRSRESGMIKQWLLIFAHAPFLRRPFSRLIFSLIYVKGVGLPPFQIPSTNLCTQLLFDSKPALFLGRAFFWRVFRGNNLFYPQFYLLPPFSSLFTSRAFIRRTRDECVLLTPINQAHVTGGDWEEAHTLTDQPL